MKDEDLDAIRARLEAAGRGPWTVHSCSTLLQAAEFERIVAEARILGITDEEFERWLVEARRTVQPNLEYLREKLQRLKAGRAHYHSRRIRPCV